MAYRVIVVESSISSQKAIQLAFANFDFEVYSFEDGLEALKSIPQIHPDAVVLSFALPSKDGYELGHFLRAQEAYKQTALVFLRGAFEPLDWKKLSNLDYDEIVQKPFDSEKLARLVRDKIEEKKEFAQLPEEPVLEEISQPDSTPEAPPLISPEWTPEVEEKIREIVKQEVQEASAQIEKTARGIVTSEFRKWLVEELKESKLKR